MIKNPKAGKKSFKTVAAILILLGGAGAGWGLFLPIRPTLGKAPDFHLTTSQGRLLSEKDLRGKVWVASFISSHCHASCPRQTAFLNQLGDSNNGLKFVAFTMDPQHDTAEALGLFARVHQVRPENWYFVTGTKFDLYHLAFDGFDITGERKTSRVLPDFIHTSRMALVDRDGVIRGYYDSEKMEDRAKLEKDLKNVL